MKIVDIAHEIYEDNNEPTYTSIPAIAFWIRGKVGAINSLLCEDFQISPNSLEITSCNGTEICIDAVAVIKQMYRLYNLQTQFNTQMQALLADSLIMVKDDFGGGGFQRVNKNEIAKTLLAFRKEESDELDKLIGAYKINRSRPIQVAGDDTIPAPYYNEGYMTMRDV